MGGGGPDVLAQLVVGRGMGFLGKYGLPGSNRYELVQFRHELSVRLGVDPDRDRSGGVLKQVRSDAGPSKLVSREPWFKSLWFGRAMALLTLVLGLLALVLVIVVNV